MFGIEKIAEIEKLVQQLNKRVQELDIEVNILRNEIKKMQEREMK